MSEGILGRKLGMTRIFDEQGHMVPVTVIQAGPCLVLRKKTAETDGYGAVQLAFDPIREKLVTKARAGEFHSRGHEPMRHLREFRLTDEELQRYEAGQTIKADLFKAGDFIDVVGVSKGRGFTGVMKRHGFKGAKASHGVHEFFRHGGSIGTSATPARVVKGRKMPGQHGNRRVTAQTLSIVAVRPAENLILVKGAVPGCPGRLVTVLRARKLRG